MIKTMIYVAVQNEGVRQYFRLLTVECLQRNFGENS